MFNRYLLTFMILCSASVVANPTVAVIGAGIAGLSAAHRLQQNGIDVQVYEARGRVGGRIFSAIVDDAVVEIGGQNITDGGEFENIRRLAQELQLEFSESKTPMKLMYFDGKSLVPEKSLNSLKLSSEALQTKVNDAVKVSHNMRDMLLQFFKESDPFFQSLSVRISAYEGAPPVKLSTYYSETLFYMLQGGVCSVHQANDEQERTLESVSIRGGNGKLPESIAKSLGERVHLNMPLVRVSKNEDRSFTLTFKNNQQVRADIVVLAIPCSIYSDITFDNEIIPQDRLDAIRNIPYGTNAKILIPFAQQPESANVFIDDEIVSWFNKDSRSLTMYFTGDSSKFTPETILEAYKHNRPAMEAAYPTAPSLQNPTYARDEAFASYKGPIGYSWPNDPYVKGSYSYIAPGQETLMTATQEVDGETVKTLFAPIDQKLFFAGEHATSLLDVPGTMEAACESGERAARMIQKVMSAVPVAL